MFAYMAGKMPITMLYDSGAESPVWCKSETRLLWAFPTAKKQPYHWSLSGFGKGPVTCNSYRIPEFRLEGKDVGAKGAGEIAYILKDLWVLAYNNPNMDCDFILSASMFSRVAVTIDQTRKERFISFAFNTGPYSCEVALPGLKPKR